jgi:hypothetical protein
LVRCVGATHPKADLERITGDFLSSADELRLRQQSGKALSLLHCEQSQGVVHHGSNPEQLAPQAIEKKRVDQCAEEGFCFAATG